MLMISLVYNVVRTNYLNSCGLVFKRSDHQYSIYSLVPGVGTRPIISIASYPYLEPGYNAILSILMIS